MSLTNSMLVVDGNAVGGDTEDLTAYQTKADNSLQTTAKTVVGGINEINSNLTNVTADAKLNTQDLTTVSRTKNIMSITLEGLKRINTSGSWNNNVYTYNGIIYTINTNSDGSISSIDVTGTNSINSNLYLLSTGYAINKYKGKIINGITGGSSAYDARRCIFIGYSNDGSAWANEKFLADGDYTISSDYDYIIFTISIAGSSNVNLTFYPMIRESYETDATYAPYIPSVESRIEAVERNNFSDAKDIKDYNASDNMFIAPNDGYIVAETTNSVIVRLYGSVNAYVNIKVDVSNNNYLYVKKGMKVYVFSNANNDSVYFIPLI